jgi:hypothetical protein
VVLVFYTGMRFGQMRVKNGLCHILSHFEVAPCKETPVPTAYDTKSLLLTLGEKMLLSFKRAQFCSHSYGPVQINHQLDATIFQFIILTFIYSSTCFGRRHAHNQELNNCSSSLWFYLRSVVIAVLLVVVGPTGPTTTNNTATTTLRR